MKFSHERRVVFVIFRSKPRFLTFDKLSHIFAASSIMLKFAMSMRSTLPPVPHVNIPVGPPKQRFPKSIKLKISDFVYTSIDLVRGKLHPATVPYISLFWHCRSFLPFHFSDLCGIHRGSDLCLATNTCLGHAWYCFQSVLRTYENTVFENFSKCLNFYPNKTELFSKTV